jgi:hypothetical protein
MSDIFQCGDNTTLVSYLYDEGEPDERRAIEAHVAVCAACAAELAALASTRQQLASWTPPGAELGFQLVRPQASDPRPQPETTTSGAWWNRPLPVWAQAAAACLIFAAGMWLGIVQGGSATDDAASLAASAPAAPVTAVTAADLSALERRLRTEMTQMRTAGSPAAGTAQTVSEAQLLARVRSLIDESEQRQQRELALRTAQVVRDFDTQRQVDMVQIQRTFGQIQGQTGAEVRDQREMLNYLMRVSQQQR